MKSTELRGMAVEELHQKELDLRKELFHLRFQLAKGELQNNKRIRAVRKDIARVLTIITEKSAPSHAGRKEEQNA